jgi:uncharacterized protein YcsI (UPF0317 family)
MIADGSEIAAAARLRQRVRDGRHTGPTAGLAPGYVQTNVVILPAALANDFEAFCRLNEQPCPLVERMAAGDPEPRRSAPGADLRTDVPQYRVFRGGEPQGDQPTDILDLWRGDLVGFLLGCSFTFEAALQEAGLAVRHIQQQCNVPMYRTNIRCRAAGPFQGPMVVSMRPFRPEQVESAAAITAQFPKMHGAPIHVGNPAAIGIGDLARPDFGDPVTIHPGEVPVFWACGVTPQLALVAARPDLAVTHAPGCMFVTDLRDEAFRDGE